MSLWRETKNPRSPKVDLLLWRKTMNPESPEILNSEVEGCAVSVEGTEKLRPAKMVE